VSKRDYYKTPEMRQLRSRITELKDQKRKLKDDKALLGEKIQDEEWSTA
jgi:hypothetical protein